MLFAQWNPAKYAFQMIKQGFSVSYTHLTGLANDISLGQATYFNKISERAFAGSYFGFETSITTN
jgi:hypothetical protein